MGQMRVHPHRTGPGETCDPPPFTCYEEPVPHARPARAKGLSGRGGESHMHGTHRTARPSSSPLTRSPSVCVSLPCCCSLHCPTFPTISHRLSQAEQDALARLKTAMSQRNITEIKRAVAAAENLDINPPELQRARVLRAQLEEEQRRAEQQRRAQEQRKREAVERRSQVGRGCAGTDASGTRVGNCPGPRFRSSFVSIHRCSCLLGLAPGDCHLWRQRR